MSSPLNAQCVFGFSATALLFLNSRTAGRKESEPNGQVLWICCILAVTIGMLWRSLYFPLVFDDYTLVTYGQDMNSLSVRHYFTQAGGDGFFRPVGYLSFGIDGLWAASSPFRWHLTGITLHAANVLLVQRLASRVLADPVASLWAAVLFGIHGTVLLTPMYLAARFDVLATFFVLAGLCLFLRYLDGRNRILLLASSICLLLGVLTKETAFVFPLLAVIVSGPERRKQWRALATFLLLAAGVFIYRYSIFAGLGGYAALIALVIRAVPGHGQLALGAAFVVLNLAALQHNLGVWRATAVLADQTCAAAATLIDAAGHPPQVSGLPREINGVPFLGSENGFGFCVEFHRPQSDQWHVPVSRLEWDPLTRTLVSK